MVKLLYVVTLLSFAAEGFGQCSLKNMSIKQTKVNEYVNNSPVWNVTIANDCYCSQSDVRIACNGFRTTKRVDPSSIHISGGRGIVNGGQPIYPYTSVGFTYAWSVPLSFKLISSQIVCS